MHTKNRKQKQCIFSFYSCREKEKGETKTKKRNNVKPDVILKDFWENKERFADLFNATLFHGEQVLKPENLDDASADKSSIVKIGQYADTVNRIFDVVKKVADYEMHLIEVRKSGTLKFHNEDVRMLFDICRMIYEKDIDKVNAVYNEQVVATDIFLAVGAVTNSQRIINKALEAEMEGTQMTMCKALQEWENQCTENGRREGWDAGLSAGLESGKIEGSKFGEAKGIIVMGVECGISKKDIIEKVKEKLNLSEQEAQDYFNQFATA